MNLIYTHRLLAAAVRRSEQRRPVTERSARKQLEEMAAAGLVEMTDQGTNAHPCIYLERLTSLGHSFLRAFPEGVPDITVPVATKEWSASEKRADPRAAAVGKWRGKFAATGSAAVH